MSIDELETALRAKAAGSSGLGALVAFDLGADGTLFLDGRTTLATVSRQGDAPATTIVISADDFGQILAGTLNPMTAFGAGKLRVQGDMGPAMKLGSVLG